MVSGHSWDLHVRSWAALGAYVGTPGVVFGLIWMYWVSGAVLGPLRAVLGHSWGLSRRSWDLCWRPWAALGLLLEVLGRYRGCCVRSWAALGTYLDGLGLLLGPIFAVMGRSWGLSLRTAAALGAYVGGLWLKNRRT